MKIIKKIPGSFSSELFLVEIKKKRYVLKRDDDTSDIISEKEFFKVLSKNNIPTLNYFENPKLKSNEILLEYIQGSVNLGDRFTAKNCKTWGKITRRMHEIKFNDCFRLNKDGRKIKQKWSMHLNKKIKKAFAKAEANNNYDYSKAELKKIRKYLSPLKTIEPKRFSLIHGDLHTNNVLIKKDKLILFDKNPEIFSGDPLLDLAIALIDMPNDTLIKTDDSEHTNDKKCLNSFIAGYRTDFLNNPSLNVYIMLIAFGRLYTPFSENYKDIILNLLEKDNQ
jgi:Ser/Thr protein kinase RdoA (MazF antagonist)